VLLFSQLFHFFDNHPVRNDHMEIITQECVSFLVFFKVYYDLGRAVIITRRSASGNNHAYNSEREIFLVADGEGWRFL